MSKTEPITEEERAQWRAEEEAATEGPWEVNIVNEAPWGIGTEKRSCQMTGCENGCTDPGDENHADCISANQIVETDSGYYPPKMPDAKLIVTMRNNWRRLLDENERLQGTVEHTREWYATRFERLRDFAHSLPKEKAHEYFSIVANGTGEMHEPPTYAQQMNILKNENERLAESVKVSAEMREEFAGMCRLLARHGHRANVWEEAALLLFQMAVDVDEDAAERIYAEAKRKAE